MLNASQLEGGWQQLLSRVGPVEELEASAKASGALLRRREIRNAADLLRLALAYGPGGMSLRAVAAWAHTMRLGELSDVAALKRLRGCAPWLQEIVGNMLARQLSCQPVMQGRIIRLVDGTTLSERGSDRADWRLHYSYDPRRGRTVECELTTAAVGEHLRRFKMAAGDIWLGDRNITAARQALERNKIRIVAEDVGSDHGRSVHFHLDDGRVEVRSLKKGNRVL